MPGYLSVPTHVEEGPTPSEAESTAEGSPPTALESASRLSPLVSNRLRDILVHVPYYTIQGRARLASDCNVSRSTISRLLNQRRSISYQLATKIANALSMRSGRLIEPQEIFALGGSYPTASVCELMGCRGCQPPSAWDEQALSLRPGWNNALPSQWSIPKENRVNHNYVHEPGDLCPLTESQATGTSSLPKIQC